MAETMSAETLLKNAGSKSDTVSGPPRPPRDQQRPTVEPPKTDPVSKLEATQSGEDLSRDETKLRDSLAMAYTGAAMGISLVDRKVGNAVAENGEQAATAWVLYARTNPKVKAALKNFAQSSALGVLVMAHAPIIMALAEPLQAKMSGKAYDRTPMTPEDLINEAMAAAVAEAAAVGSAQPGNL